jgi:hypothetical protein
MKLYKHVVALFLLARLSSGVGWFHPDFYPDNAIPVTAVEDKKHMQSYRANSVLGWGTCMATGAESAAVVCRVGFVHA